MEMNLGHSAAALALLTQTDEAQGAAQNLNSRPLEMLSLQARDERQIEARARVHRTEDASRAIDVLQTLDDGHGHGLALDDADANAVGELAPHLRVVHPGQRFDPFFR